MKRIAIFCDGTWNRADAKHPTNVVCLSLAVKQTAKDGKSQQLIYLPGVGTGQGVTRAARLADKFLGGALGWGITDNIEEAYRHLAFSYEPGDDIFIFGFSRGAFTARSLAGLIRSCGIPSRENVRRIPEAIARYRSRDPRTKPNSEHSYEWRKVFSPWRATSPEEVDWRRDKGHASELLEIAYLGIWDTVGALGVPAFFPGAPVLNKNHAFHDQELSRIVKSARHCVAIDEQRRTFPPTLWSNLDTLNKDRANRPYRQEWLPGDHGAIGGSGEQRGLSNHALVWISEGAMAAGLWIDPVALASFEKDSDHLADLGRNSVRRAGVFGALTGFARMDRAGPKNFADVHISTRRRWHAPSPTQRYRPVPLTALTADMDAGPPDD